MENNNTTGLPAGGIRIWLDDIRPAPAGYCLCRSVNEAKRLILECEQNGTEIMLIDCDHDLGDQAGNGGDGIKLIDWLAERKTYYPIALHTVNPVGRENMQREIDRYWGKERGETMTGENGITELGSIDLEALNLTGLLGCSVAGGGACGEPGDVKLLMEDGALYRFNFIESGVRPEELQSRIVAAGLRGFAYLGLGNVLYFHEEDAAWLLQKRDEYMQTSDESFAAFPTATLYKKWVDFFREHISET